MAHVELGELSSLFIVYNNYHNFFHFIHWLVFDHVFITNTLYMSIKGQQKQNKNRDGGAGCLKYCSWEYM